MKWCEVFVNPNFLGSLLGALITGGTAICIMLVNIKRENSEKRKVYLTHYELNKQYIDSIHKTLEDLEFLINTNTEIFETDGRYPDFNETIISYKDELINLKFKLESLDYTKIPHKNNLFKTYLDLRDNITRLSKNEIYMYLGLRKARERMAKRLLSKIKEAKEMIEHIKDETNKINKKI